MIKQLLTLIWTSSMMFCVCHAEDITIQYSGLQAKVTQTKKDSVSVTIDGATVNVESLYESHKLTLLLKGSSDNGQFILKTKGKAKLTLDNLNLTSQEGAPLHLKNKKKVEIVAAKGSENTLTITACNDTANHKAATIWAKDKLLLSGKGTLNIIATGDGCRGIKSKKDITIEDLTLNVTTSGNNLGEMPSVPTNENAKQPTALLIGLGVEQDEPINIYDANKKLLETVTIPFSLRRSASIVSNPAFKHGKTYTIKTKGYERTFTFKENFTIVR